MNHHHRKILHSLFAHPVGANIDFDDVTHVLEHLGADVESKSGNKVEVAFKGQKAVLHRHSHILPKTEVMQIRKFLEDCGVSPETYPV